MAAEVSMFSLAQIQNHAQQQHQMAKPGMRSWTAGHRAPAADHGSNWEVRAFAEDRGSSMDITWPPRSYACTFCSREFRSAQALGGHMNVHRRERARLHQSNQAPDTPSSNNSNPSITFPPPQFIPSNGLHIFYPIRTLPILVSDVPSIEPAHAALNLFPGMAGCIKNSIHGITRKDSGDAIVAEDMDLELRL